MYSLETRQIGLGTFPFSGVFSPIGQQEADILGESDPVPDIVANHIIHAVAIGIRQILQDDIAAGAVSVFHTAGEAVIPVICDLHPVVIVGRNDLMLRLLAANFTFITI